VAPEDWFQLSVGEVAWFVAPLDGKSRVGVFGGRFAPGDFTLPFVKIADMFVLVESVTLLAEVNVNELEPVLNVN